MNSCLICGPITSLKRSLYSFRADSHRFNNKRKNYLKACDRKFHISFHSLCRRNLSNKKILYYCFCQCTRFLFWFKLELLGLLKEISWVEKTIIFVTPHDFFTGNVQWDLLSEGTRHVIARHIVPAARRLWSEINYVFYHSLRAFTSRSGWFRKQ